MLAMFTLNPFELLLCAAVPLGMAVVAGIVVLVVYLARQQPSNSGRDAFDDHRGEERPSH
jgi:hypothetical protein